MTETPRKTTPAKRAPAKRATNARSRSTSVAVAERASATERGSEPIPGTSLVMHRFPHGALAGKPWIGVGGVTYEDVRPAMNEIASQLAVWTEDLKLKAGVTGDSMLDRNSYVPPASIFDQMRLARHAIENDDVVGAVADGTEAMALNGIHWESVSFDDADVFNQWAQRVNLDFFVRACWRELMGCSEYIGAKWWGFQDFRVRGNGPPQMEKIEPPADEMTGIAPAPIFRPVREDDGTLKKGQKRKKEYKGIYCPMALTLLDPTKVLPLGNLMFGQERLVWVATKPEMTVWQNIQSGATSRFADPIMTNFFTRQYIPDDTERDMIRKLDTGINPEMLLEMNPAYVWRHTLTRPHYKPWADVRMKRVFRWLDQKQQLLAADRVALVGNANYILLVKKGEKDNPASQTELDELNANFAYVAKLPVIIGDHTLSIEIITPKTDHTLDRDKYAVINESIRDSLLGTFTFDTGEERGAAPLTGRMISRGLQNRRIGIKRDYEENLGRAITDHPFNEGKFEEDPNLTYTPRNVNLDTDQALLQTMVAIAGRGDMSRMTLLEEIGYDEEEEARRREMEAQHYDPIFKTTVTPGSPNNPFAPDGGPGNNGGGALPPGGGGGGKPPGGGPPPAKRTAAPAKTTPAKTTTRQPRGKNRPRQ